VALISKVLNGKYETIKLKEFIISYQYGLSEKASKEKIGTPMLRMNNIFNSEIVVDNLKYINIDGSIKNKYRLNKGDLLFNRTNSKELVGKTAIFNKDGEYTFASYLIRVVIDSTKANLNYINFLFNSTLLKYQKDMISRQITGQANINAQEMQDFLFPLPPLKIQTEIANTIEKMKAKMKTLQQQAEENRKLAIEEFEKEIFQ
jgi:restriction endonuclease S subunit